MSGIAESTENLIAAGIITVVGTLSGMLLSFCLNEYKKYKDEEKIKLSIYNEMDDVAKDLNTSINKIKEAVKCMINKKQFPFKGIMVIDEFHAFKAHYQNIAYKFQEYERRNIKTFISSASAYSECMEKAVKYAEKYINLKTIPNGEEKELIHNVNNAYFHAMIATECLKLMRSKDKELIFLNSSRHEKINSETVEMFKDLV